MPMTMDVFKVMPYLNRFKNNLVNRVRDVYDPDREKPWPFNKNKRNPNVLDLFPRDYTGNPPSIWATKLSSSPWADGEDGVTKRKNSSAVRLEAYRQRRRDLTSTFPGGRVTGRIRFKTKPPSSAQMKMEALNSQVLLDHHHHDHPDAHRHQHHHEHAPDYDEFEPVTCGHQFREYCANTSLHGWQYLAEKKRSKLETIFWLSWCIFGIGAAMYMMSKIWTKWERNPIITSVATTNYPVSSVTFPAVTICTVNKASTEKLIIQGCRYNFTLSQMRTIISVLVDPDARNNDHLNVDRNYVKPEVALQYLRLVAPKCEDYLLTCRWNSAPALCTQMFRLVLTDSGYCCSFNAVATKRSRRDSVHDMELALQEKEYEYLQRAVWEYTDNYRNKQTSGGGGGGGGTGGGGGGKGNKGGGGSYDDIDTADPATPVVENFNCARIYDDDLFPSICHYLERCRHSEKCRERNKIKSNATVATPVGAGGSSVFNFFAETFPLKAPGAGRSRGLSLMLDTLRCDTVPTESFKGLKVYVHNADDFPAVSERGYIVGPGMETQIGVQAVDTYSTNVLKGFYAHTRGCFFPSEFPLKFYKEYSRSACIVECETEFVNQECQCVTYYAPGNYSVCGLKKYQNCVKKALDAIQKKAIVPASSLVEQEIDNHFQFKTSKDREQDKTCGEFCLPSCNETFYDVFVTAADFPNQPVANQTKLLREAIFEGGHTQLNDISYVSGSISVLRVFFSESSIMQYKRDELFTWEDFVSNIGGVLGLCMGFSMISVVEVLYFFSFRWHMDRLKWKELTTVAELVE